MLRDLYSNSTTNAMELKLLGIPVLMLNGKNIEIKRKKVRALLYYIAANDRGVSREELIDVLWSSQDIEAAQHNLSSNLYALKKVLPGAIIMHDNNIKLHTGVKVDVCEFSNIISVIDAKKCQELLRLYQGKFLKGFSLSNNQRFEEWQITKGDQYLQIAINASAFIGKSLIDEGLYTKSLEILSDAIEWDPLREDLYRLYMQACYLNGNRPGASIAYQRLLHVLDEELGIPPMPETIEIYASIVQDTYLQKNSFSKPSETLKTNEAKAKLPFVGRESELSEMKALSSEYLVVILGSAGIGKTRLCQEFASRTNHKLIRVACKELEQTAPYFPFIKGIRSMTYDTDWKLNAPLLRSEIPSIWWNTLCALIPEVDPQFNSKTSISEDPHIFWEAIYQFFLALSRIRPFVLLLDDLQWADHSSLSLLQYMACQENREKLIIIGTQRTYCTSESLNKALDSIDGEGKLRTIELPLLRAEDISAITAHYLDTDTASTLVVRLQEVSHGNPCILVAIIRYLMRKDYAAGGEMSLSQDLIESEHIPKAVRSYYNVTVGRLQPKELRFLEAAAIIETAFDFTMIPPVAMLDESSAQEALEGLLSKGMIQVKGNGKYGFEQIMLRELIREQLGEKSRAYHLRIAQEMESDRSVKFKTNAHIIAFHYMNSNQPEKSATYAVIAGDHASQLGSYNEAIDHYIMAAEYLSGIELLSVLESLASKYVKHGECEKAVRTRKRAAEIAKRDGYISLFEFFSASAIVTSWGDFSELTRGIVPLYKHEPDSILMKHYDKAEQSVASMPDDNFLMRIKIGKAIYLLCIREFNGAIKCYQQLLEIMERSDSAQNTIQLILFAKMQICSCMLALGDSAVDAYVEDGYAQAWEVNAVEYIPMFMILRNAILQRQKRFNEAEALLDQAQTLIEKVKNNYVTCAIQIQKSYILVHRSEIEAACVLLRSTRTLARNIDARHLWVQAWLRLLPLLEDPESEQDLNELIDFALSVGDTGLLNNIYSLLKGIDKNRSY